MIISGARFNDQDVAHLGEDAGRCEDRGQTLELQRHVATNLFNPQIKTPTYDLIVCVGDQDLTFAGMSRDALRQLSVELERLSCAEY